MSDKKNIAIILSAAFFSEAIAADNADLKALFGQAIGYMEGLEVKLVNFDQISAELVANKANLLNYETRIGAAEEKNTSLLSLLDAANLQITELLENGSGEKLEDLFSQIAALRVERDEALTEISTLSGKLDMQEKVQGLEGILVTVGGASKMLIGKRFQMRDTDGSAIVLTHEELAQRQDLLDIMHSKGSGSLVDPEELTKGLTE